MKLPIGLDDFKEVIEDDYFYADKTGLIEEVLTTSAKVQLITRPRLSAYGTRKTSSLLRIGSEISIHVYLAACFPNW